MDLRKTALYRETIGTDAFGAACEPVTRVVTMAVFRNPLAGRFVQDLSQLFDIGRTLGEQPHGRTHV